MKTYLKNLDECNALVRFQIEENLPLSLHFPPLPPIMLPYAIYIIYVNIKFDFNINNMAMKKTCLFDFSYLCSWVGQKS